VGEETAHDLAIHFRTLDNIMGASAESMARIYGVGGVVAESVSLWFADQENRDMARRLCTHVRILEITPRDGPLTGKTFVVTGTLTSMSRDEAHAQIRALGGKVGASITKHTTYLVVGEGGGAKRAQAEKLGVEMLNEQEFATLLA
jgi:DNA ligase (NAD+)